MTTLNEHELHAMAGKLRNAIGPDGMQPHYLRNAMATTADTFDHAAEGVASQQTVQASVDLLNAAFDRQLDEAHDAFERADAGDDLEAWRDALIALVSLLPEWELRVVKDAFSAALDDMLEEALKFAEMEPAGSC